MRILAVEEELPGVSSEDCAPLLAEEARRLWELYRAGHVREAYFRGDRHTAVLVLESPSPETARALVDSLPLVRDGLIRFALIPLVPYTGFERLFGGNRGGA